MKLRKRENSPFWLADLVGVDGARIRKSTGETSKAEALEKAEEMQAEIRKEQKEARDGKRPISISEALSRYTSKLKAVHSPSIRRWTQLQDKVLGQGDFYTGKWSLDGARPLHSLTAIDLDDLVSNRTSEGNALQTIAHEIKLLRAATYYVAGLGFRTPELHKWNLPKLPQKTRYLTLEEWKAVYDQLTPAIEVHAVRKGKELRPYPLKGEAVKRRQDAQDLFVVLTMTGARLSELLHLSWEQVNLKRGTITLWGSKVGKEREVPITVQARSVLERRRAARTRGVAFVFPGRDGRSPRTAAVAILRAMRDADLNRPDLVARMGSATIHSLRHTYATWLRQRGVDLDDVSALLGHSTLDMTMRYAHVGSGERLDRARAALTEVGR